ncbi:hypothetical protein DL95DRAFT_10986 [Leptodontidium sp. 2 PMI_412]|nr:hypothetical protein DL95DRAFT_10986 [Leptodontidium sp. 2 PMI_412]
MLTGLDRERQQLCRTPATQSDRKKCRKHLSRSPIRSLASPTSRHRSINTPLLFFPESSFFVLQSRPPPPASTPIEMHPTHPTPTRALQPIHRTPSTLPTSLYVHPTRRRRHREG